MYRSLFFDNFLTLEFLNFSFNLRGNPFLLIGSSLYNRYDNISLVNSIFYLLTNLYGSNLI